eukprot:4055124-Heterocapsa_arctica.AAC.1
MTQLRQTLPACMTSLGSSWSATRVSGKGECASVREAECARRANVREAECARRASVREGECARGRVCEKERVCECA